MCGYGTDCDDCGLRDNSPPPTPPPPMQTMELSTYPGSLSDALRALAQPRADGSAQPRVPVTIALPGGEYIMENGIAIDAHMAASELWIIGESSSASMSESNGPSIIGTVIRAMPGNEDNVPLLQISAGGPFVHLVNLHIVGAARPILVSGGEVIMENCALENSTEGFTVKVNNGSLALRDSVLRGNQAKRGGALQVLGGSVDVRRSRLEENHASDSGGAVYLHGGTLNLAERTLLVGNRAPFGRSVYIDAGSVAYALPAPLGRWIYAPGSQRAVIGVGAIDDDYPFACSPGLYGDSYDVAQQSGPSCTAACPAGYFCGGATVEPSLCMNGTYCIKGSPSPVKCPAGSFSNRQMLKSSDECIGCPAGSACGEGSVVPNGCTPGSYASSPGAATCTHCEAGKYQRSRGSTACLDCLPGSFCPHGAAAPTACPAGLWSGKSGLSDSSQCEYCPLGAYCPEGSSTPQLCPAGTIGTRTMRTERSFCEACIAHTYSAPGSSACTWCTNGYYERPNMSSYVEAMHNAVCDTCLDGADCAPNTKLSTVRLKRGRWRLSPSSRVVSRCTRATAAGSGGAGDVNAGTPCRGGEEAGIDGAGYCLEGHRGPLCEVCTQAGQYFDRDLAHCVDCPKAGLSVTILMFGTFLLTLLVAGCRFIKRRAMSSAASTRQDRLVRHVAAWQQRILLKMHALALMPKLKLCIAFYQSIEMLPKVYGVRLPAMYYEWMRYLTWFNLDWSAM